MTPSPVQPGDIIAGKFRVERVLGVGGMGVVVLATNLALDQRVALKFLLPESAGHPDVAARFAREAMAAAKIQSEHVAKVLDVGRLENGAPYMVMEFMDGEDLEHVLARVGPMPVPLAVGYLLQATEAVAEAHAVGIVHRDLKPANLFLAKRPSGVPIIKVLDFGISKQTMSTSQASMTKTSAILGSPLYMSPEQMASSKSVDMRSDIWALGVVLYELLVKQTPFPADTMPELVAAILQREAEPLSRFRPDIPPGLDAVVARCLEKDPKRRFQNVAEMAAALAPFGPPRSDISVERIIHVLGVSPAAVAAPPPGQAWPQPATGARTNAEFSGSVARDASSSRTKLWLAVPFVLAGAGAAVFALYAHGPKPTAAGDQVASSSAAAVEPPPASSTSASAEPAASATPSPPASSPSAGPSAAAVASAAAAVPAAQAHARPAVAPPVASPAPSSVAHTKPATPTPAAAPAAPVCTMISYVDGDGNKRFKQECK
jgi:serine/threonine-protein kinase